jgi:hypothetical protein
MIITVNSSQRIIISRLYAISLGVYNAQCNPQRQMELCVRPPGVILYICVNVHKWTDKQIMV